jgi:SAM-dependent methyltransferase
MSATDQILQEQIAYYSARAEEYDEWFLRKNRYDRGPEHKQQWFAEIGELAAALDAFAPSGDILELACGTGLWSQRLAPYAKTLTAVDSSPEVIEINRRRVRAPTVRYVKADLFQWRPDRQYDTIFFSFWLSHVPPERFEPFWAAVRAALAPGGRIFLIDSLYSETSTAHDHALEGPQSTTLKRRLNDGREFRIVKVFYDPRDLERRLSALGIDATARTTPTHFLYASGRATRSGA